VTTREPIPFIDLAAQRRRLLDALNAAVLRVMDHGSYIMGPEVIQLEADLAAFCGARHVVSCANGTDALGLVLMAMEIGAGDAVFCPTFTFCATAEAVAWVGATPVLVDVQPDTFNMNPESLEISIDIARRKGLRPAAIIPVDLFGQPADHDAIERIAARDGLWVLCDAAQSFGATYRKRKVGAIGLATITSFFPAKPLGCYGDGGAVFTNDDGLAETMRSLRVHGQGSDKYDNVRIGINGRLDTIQAAVLIEKLKIFPEEIERRDQIAKRYNDHLGENVIVPIVPDGLSSVWAQYTIRLPGFERRDFVASLKAEGIPTAIYYPKPLHRQSAYAHYPTADGELPVAERLAGEVVSLPMHPYLSTETQNRIIAAVQRANSTQIRRQEGGTRSKPCNTNAQAV
jgi:UDP-2-acetamido-2-deoxy-ribo-hexuluronate aminotransferase